MAGVEMWGLTRGKIHPDAPGSYWGIGSAIPRCFSLPTSPPFFPTQFPSTLLSIDASDLISRGSRLLLTLESSHNGFR